MNRKLDEILDATRIEASSILDFLRSPAAPADPKDVWRIDDRLAHLVRDHFWREAVAEATELGERPASERLLALVGHERRVLINGPGGILRGSPPRWTELGRACELIPAGCRLDIRIEGSGTSDVALTTPDGVLSRKTPVPSIGVCYLVLLRLAAADPLADGIPAFDDLASRNAA
jgi:hypothetical protein